MDSDPPVSQFGMFIMEPAVKPTLKVHRFKIYKRGTNPLLLPERQKQNLNFQVCGTSQEFFTVRIYLDAKKQIEDVRCYYFPGFDSELAEYISKALINWLNKKYKISTKIRYKFLEVWR